MNKTILSIAVGVVFFLTFTLSSANVCTISANHLNGFRRTSQELAIISNDTDQCKFGPADYSIRDAYRTRNLNTRSENRRIRVDGKVEERRLWFRADDDARRVGRLTRSRSLPDIRRERVRDARERDVDFGGADRRRAAVERNDRRLLENRLDRRTPRREIRDSRYERQSVRDDADARRRTSQIRQNDMVTLKDKNDTTAWPFSNFVQSAIGVLGLYYFGMHNKSAK